jgi:ribosomal protein S18 acetylase RimI-like enzyme
MKYTIRRLNIGEADLYRSVRLESLRESPEAFASSYESALSRTHESWLAQADASAAGRDRATFVVLEGQAIGLAALYRNDDLSNEGELIQVWVSPGSRGGKVATDLMDTVFHWAASNGFGMIRAEVTSNNSRALRFYENYGFVRTNPDKSPDESSYILTMKVEQPDGAPNHSDASSSNSMSSIRGSEEL